MTYHAQLENLICPNCGGSIFKGRQVGDQFGIYCCNWIKWADKAEKAQFGTEETQAPDEEHQFQFNLIVAGLNRIEAKLDQILGGSNGGN